MAGERPPPPTAPPSVAWWQTPAFVPWLMALVIGSQVALVRWTALSPWKGSGFGMFSTLDSIEDRRVSAFVTLEGAELPVDLSDGFDTVTHPVISQPTQERADRVVSQLLNLRWVVNEDGDAQPDRSPEALSAESVKLVVDTPAFDPHSKQVQMVPLVTASISREGEPSP